jgi:transposase InsO family protein
MVGKVLAMNTRLAMLVAAEQPGVSVSELCRTLGVSRQTFYKLRRRFAQEGPAGLEPRSRRPHRSPAATADAMEETIVRLRKELPLDNGAQTIAYHLARAGMTPPSVRTIHRVLVRRGMVTAQPEKRPRSSYRRFEFDAPNACWQIDATWWPLAGGVGSWIMDVLDDHSRVCVAARVGTGATAELAWEAFEHGARDWGLPAMVLSDNGSCFVSRKPDGVSSFTRTLDALGIRTINARPYHPQTCGKIERFHQTLKAWLHKHPLATNHRQLQAQLDEFLSFYNRQRPHRALHGLTPTDRWHAQPAAQPGEPSPQPATVIIGSARVNANGMISLGKAHLTSVGSQWQGAELTTIRYGTTAVILNGHELVRRLTIDPTRRYQPTGRKRGGPKKTRHVTHVPSHP